MVKIIIEDIEDEDAERLIMLFSTVEAVDLAINAGSGTQSSEPTPTPSHVTERKESDVKPTKKPKTWKFDYSVLDNKEREEQNTLIQSLKDRGASWSEMGKYLGVRADTLRKRVSVHQTRGVKKANKAFKKKLPNFEEITNEELVATVYGMVTAVAGKPNMIITASNIANLIGDNLRNTYKMTPYLNKYCMQLESRIIDIFENIGKILGIAKCMFTRADNESGQISGQLMFYSTDFMDLGEFSYVYRRLE